MFKRLSVLAVALTAAAGAQAAINVSAATSAIDDILPAIGTVFGSLVVVCAGVLGYKWVMSFIGKR